MEGLTITMYMVNHVCIEKLFKPTGFYSHVRFISLIT